MHSYDNNHCVIFTAWGGGSGMCRGHEWLMTPFFRPVGAPFPTNSPSMRHFKMCTQFQFLEKFCIFSLVFGQNFSSQDAKFLNFPINVPLMCTHFQFLEKFCIFSLVFCQNFTFSFQDAKFLNYRSQNPLFFKENQFPRPYFWKPAQHIPTKKSWVCPPSSFRM